jgi:hypothetical protein
LPSTEIPAIRSRAVITCLFKQQAGKPLADLAERQRFNAFGTSTKERCDPLHRSAGKLRMFHRDLGINCLSRKYTDVGCSAAVIEG